MNFIAKVAVLLFCVAISGCGWWNTVFRDFNINDGKGAMIDIKQRAIMVSHQPSLAGQSGAMQTIVCAEPSPDAIAAYAAELAGNVNVLGKVNAGGTAASQESAAFVGLRTQSIQLLRDSLYRLCEGYMSGALKKEDYYLLTRRYQRYMIALLGIEQLTGALRSPSVTINTEGNAKIAASLSEMRKEIENIDQEIAKKQGKLASLESERSGSGVTSERKNQIETEIESINAAIKGQQADKDAINEGLKDAQGLVAGGSATATVSPIGLLSQRSDEHVQAVAGVVENIVLQAMGVDDFGQFCWSYLTALSDKSAEPAQEPINAEDAPQTLESICKNRFQQNDKDREVARNFNKEWLTLYQSATNLPLVQKMELLKQGRSNLSESQNTSPSVMLASQSLPRIFQDFTKQLNATLASYQQASDPKPSSGVPESENLNPDPFKRSLQSQRIEIGNFKEGSSQIPVSPEPKEHSGPPFQIFVQETSFNDYKFSVNSLEDLKSNLKRFDSIQLCTKYYSGTPDCYPKMNVDSLLERDLGWLTTIYKTPSEVLRYIGGQIFKTPSNK